MIHVVEILTAASFVFGCAGFVSAAIDAPTGEPEAPACWRTDMEPWMPLSLAAVVLIGAALSLARACG